MIKLFRMMVLPLYKKIQTQILQFLTTNPFGKR